jgi:hypothetical protein
VTLNLKQRYADYSEIRIATRLLAEQRNRDSGLSRKKRLLSSPKSPDSPWNHSLSCSLGKVGGFPEVKRPGCKHNHSLPSRSAVCHKLL